MDGRLLPDAQRRHAGRWNQHDHGPSTTAEP